MTTVRLVPHASAEYWEAVRLRREVLRYPLGLDFRDEELSAESADLHLVSVQEDAVVGCLVLSPLGCNRIKMRQVAVQPRLQGQGVGRQMVMASEREASVRGFTEMVLHARDTAVPFYLRVGYRVVGEPFTEVGIPHRVMEKSLKPGHDRSE